MKISLLKIKNKKRKSLLLLSSETPVNTNFYYPFHMAGYISRDSSSLDLTSGAFVSATNTSEVIFCYCLLLFQFKQSLIKLVANFCGWNRSCMISSKRLWLE
jgi:hypothetical protein